MKYCLIKYINYLHHFPVPRIIALLCFLLRQDRKIELSKMNGSSTLCSHYYSGLAFYAGTKTIPSMGSVHTQDLGAVSLGSFSNDDGDSIEDVKKAIGLY